MKKKAIGHLVKTNPIQTRSKPIRQRVKLMQSVYLQRIMKKNADRGYEKTKPIKANFRKNEYRGGGKKNNGYPEPSTHLNKA